MNIPYIIGQCLGILGMASYILSFQSKKNSLYFIAQTLGGFFFALNFLLIQAFPGFVMNTVNIIRGIVLMKSDKKIYKLILCETLCVGSVLACLKVNPESGIYLAFTLITLGAQITGTFFMWRANGAHIRYTQLFVLSPAWLAYDILNFSPGGIICESFNAISVIVSFLRHGKGGFEKAKE